MGLGTVLFLMGGFAMATVTVSTEVKAPVEQVFALFTDIEHAAGRVAGIKKIEVLSPGPFNLGYRWIETREVMGRLDDALMEITAFERNRKYTVTHHKGGVLGSGVRIDTVFTFEPVLTGTKVSIEFALRPEGLPPAVLLPLEWAIGGKVRHVLSDDLEDLKASIEKVARS
jgi:carbon monoxide dehydrogenase subunit G